MVEATGQTYRPLSSVIAEPATKKPFGNLLTYPNPPAKGWTALDALIITQHETDDISEIPYPFPYLTPTAAAAKSAHGVAWPREVERRAGLKEQ